MKLNIKIYTVAVCVFMVISTTNGFSIRRISKSVSKTASSAVNSASNTASSAVNSASNTASSAASSAANTASSAVNSVSNTASSAVNSASNTASSAASSAANTASSAVNSAANTASKVANTAGNVASEVVKIATGKWECIDGDVILDNKFFKKILNKIPSRIFSILNAGKFCTSIDVTSQSGDMTLAADVSFLNSNYSLNGSFSIDLDGVISFNYLNLNLIGYSSDSNGGAFTCISGNDLITKNQYFTKFLDTVPSSIVSISNAGTFCSRTTNSKTDITFGAGGSFLGSSLALNVAFAINTSNGKVSVYSFYLSKS